MKWLSIVFLMLFLLNAPSAEAAGLVTCSGPDCNFCTFIMMVNNLVSWLVGFLTIAAVLAIAYAGFKLVVSGGDEGAMTDAKKMLTNIVIGFVIVLSAWLIVDTLMKALVAPSADFGVWNEIETNQCGGINTPTESADNLLYCYDTPGSGTTNLHGQSACEDARAQAIEDGQSPGACYLCGS